MNIKQGEWPLPDLEVGDVVKINTEDHLAKIMDFLNASILYRVIKVRAKQYRTRYERSEQVVYIQPIPLDNSSEVSTIPDVWRNTVIKI